MLISVEIENSGSFNDVVFLTKQTPQKGPIGKKYYRLMEKASSVGTKSPESRDPEIV
jgi:hypothetical protein